MNFLVGSLVLSGGERIIIVWSDGRRTEAVYQDTFGYTHVFRPVTRGGKSGFPIGSCGRRVSVSSLRKQTAESNRVQA